MWMSEEKLMKYKIQIKFNCELLLTLLSEIYWALEPYKKVDAQPDFILLEKDDGEINILIDEHIEIEVKSSDRIVALEIMGKILEAMKKYYKEKDDLDG